MSLLGVIGMSSVDTFVLEPPAPSLRLARAVGRGDGGVTHDMEKC